MQIVLTLALAAVAASARADAPNIDPKAKHVLDEMVRAYRTVRTLEQQTTYTDGGPYIRSRLVIQRPNRLVYEMTSRAASRPNPVLTRLQCDGKLLYTYQEERGWYTRVAAPKNFAGFRDMAGSLELAAITGIDPFEKLAQQAKSARLADPENINGVPSDVVEMDISDELHTGSVRLYVGQADHLLRRFTYETQPRPRVAPKHNPDVPSAGDPGEPSRKAPDGDGKVPDGDSGDDTEAAPADLGPTGTRFSFDNVVTVDQAPAKDTFTWIAPAGALLYQDLSGILRAARKGRKGTPSVVILGNAADPNKPTKVLTQKELIEQAKKQKR